MTSAFAEGGWPMYGVLCLAVFGHVGMLGAVIGGFVSKERGFVLVAGSASLLLGLATCGFGGFGYALGMKASFDAVAGVEPELRAQLLAQGISESMNNLAFGIVAAVLPTLIGLGVLVRGFAMKAATGPRG